MYDDKIDRLSSGTEDGIVTTAGMIRPETKADTVSVAGCVWNGGVETGEPQRYVREYEICCVCVCLCIYRCVHVSKPVLVNFSIVFRPVKYRAREKSYFLYGCGISPLISGDERTIDLSK